MTNLYDQRIDAMKARERIDMTRRDHMTYWTAFCEDESNRERLATYKRKRGFVLWVSQGPDAWQVGTDYKHDT